MITDAVLRFVASVINFIVNLLPDAPIIAVGNGAASGYACCVAFVTNSIGTTLATTTVVGGVIQQVIQNIGNSPLAVLLDWQLLGFFAGCALAILTAFLVIKILMAFWMLAKL